MNNLYKSMIVISTLLLAIFSIDYVISSHSRAQQEEFCKDFGGVEFYYGLVHEETFKYFMKVGKCKRVFGTDGKETTTYYTEKDFKYIKTGL